MLNLNSPKKNSLDFFDLFTLGFKSLLILKTNSIGSNGLIK